MVRSALLLLTIAACAPPPVGVTVKLVFDGSNCTCTSIDTCTLPSAGEVGLFAVDDTADTVLQTTCANTGAGQTLADLPTLLGNGSAALPAGKHVAVELVVYPDQETCPRVWDGTGFTTTPDGAQPTYGGRSNAVALDGGDALTIDVPVGCL